MKNLKCLLLLLPLLITGCGSRGDDINDSDVVEFTLFRYDITNLKTAITTKSDIAQYVTNKFNLKVTVKNGDGQSWEDNLNLNIQTGRIPDLFVCYGPDRPKQYKKWVEQEILLPISDYVSETKHANIYKRLQDNPGPLSLSYCNGKQYSIPISTFGSDHALYIRTDWLKNVNAKPKFDGEPNFTEDSNRFNLTGPKTMEEFYYVCKAFTEQDPDNNPNNATYGFTTGEENLWFTNFAFYAFDEGGFHDRILDKSENVYVDSWIADGSKEAVRFYNKLYKEGLIDPEFIANTNDDKVDKFISGKAGIMMTNGISGYNYIYNQYEKVNHNHEFTFFAAPKGPTGLSGIRGSHDSYCYTAISSSVTANERERLLSLLDWMMSEEGEMIMTYGIKGVHYDEDANGNIVSLLGKDASGKSRTLSDVDYGSLFYSFVGLTESKIYPWSDNKEDLERMKTIIMGDRKLYTPLEFYDGNNILAIGQALDEFAQTQYSLMIKDNGNFDANWASFKNEYLTTYQGQKVQDEFNNAVNRLINK